MIIAGPRLHGEGLVRTQLGGFVLIMGWAFCHLAPFASQNLAVSNRALGGFEEAITNSHH